MFDNFFSGNRAVYEIMWENIEEWGRPQLTIWRMRIACCITKATNAHSEYMILFAFPLQQWLFERPHCYGHTHVACPVSTSNYVFSCIQTKTLRSLLFTQNVFILRTGKIV